MPLICDITVVSCCILHHSHILWVFDW